MYTLLARVPTWYYVVAVEFLNPKANALQSACEWLCWCIKNKGL